MQFVQFGRGMAAGRKTGAVVLPTIQALSAYWEAETPALETALSLTAAEKYAIDEFIKHCKAGGFWTRNAALTNTGIWLMCQGTEAKCLVNLLHPGTRDLVKNGSPTFAAFDGVSSSASTAFYDTSIPINGVSLNSVSIGCDVLTGNAGLANAYEMGVLYNSSAARLALMSAAATTNVTTGATMSATASLGTSMGQYSMKAMSRTGAAGYNYFNAGLARGTITAASVSTSDTTTITLLKANGLSVAGQQKCALYFVLDGLSDAEMAILHAAIRTLVDAYRYALPKVQPAGYGDATVTVDAVYAGNSLSAFARAYAAKEQGLNVAIVLDWMAEHVTQFGGHPAGGLGWVDIGGVSPATTGIFNEMGVEINARAGNADGNTQGGRSFDGRSWSIEVRKLCDPNRSGGNIPGRDIPIYMSTGFRSVAKNGSNAITSLTTNDGRVFNASIFGDETYEGDLIYLAGLPYTIGREADGTSQENKGYHIAQVGRPNDGSTSYNLNCRVDALDPSSALLPFISLPPSYTEGQAYPAVQQNCFRLTAQSSTPRHGTLMGGVTWAPPAGYDAANYEIVGRYLAACTAGGHTATITEFFTTSRAVRTLTTAAGADLNNSTAISSDFGQTGNDYIQAGMNIAARKAAMLKNMAWMQGLIYWIAQSGDARIPAALVTSFGTTWGLDYCNHLGRVSWKPLYWPGVWYRREPTYQLNNDANGGFRYTANDSIRANGATPRSVKTISNIKYDFDHHAEITIEYDAGSGPVLHRQGGFSGVQTTVLGANGYDPWPLEASLPNKADCPNLGTSTAPSMTKAAWSGARMEPSMVQAAECLGVADYLAVSGGIALQDVNYTTLRAAVLALPRGVAADIPQTN